MATRTKEIDNRWVIDNPNDYTLNNNSIFISKIIAGIAIFLMILHSTLNTYNFFNIEYSVDTCMNIGNILLNKFAVIAEELNTYNNLHYTIDHGFFNILIGSFGTLFIEALFLFSRWIKINNEYGIMKRLYSSLKPLIVLNIVLFIGIPTGENSDANLITFYNFISPYILELL